MLRLALTFIVVATGMFASACRSGSTPETAGPTPPVTPAPSTAASAAAIVTRDGSGAADGEAAPPVTHQAPAAATISVEAGQALAADIKRAIDADPRITSEGIEVWYEPPAVASHERIRLSGTVANDEEKVRLLAIAAKHTDLPISSIFHIIDEGWDAEPAGPWVEPPVAAPRIPLCAGLTVVTAIASQGDYESIKTILSVTPDHVRMKYSSESSPPWWTPFRDEFKQFTTSRTILTRDLASAHSYAQIFTGTKHVSETAPGTTAIGTSADVLRELKARGESAFSYCTAADDIVVLSDGKPRETPAGCSGFTDPFPLRRVGTSPVLMNVLVDGDPVQLPAVLARGKTSFGDRVEFAFLNDEQNPLTLGFRVGIGLVPALRPSTREMCENEGRKGGMILINGSCDLPDGGDRDTLRVTTISTRCEVPPAGAPASPGDPPPSAGGGEGLLTGEGSGAGAAALERALIEKGSVDVYSIYFSFNSDALREESTPTLEDIATILRRHPTWKLRLNGHTDSIGTENANLDLSRRRAAAVRRALVTEYGIAPDRLDTAGFGESQPKDTNETIEGRARNRRVELVRSGS